MKSTRTYSIENKLFDKFDDICKKRNINRSQWIEDKIKEFISKEMIIDPKSYYKLKFDTEDNYLTIKERKDNFVIMSNGNMIDVFDFEKMYEETDPYVKQVVNEICGSNLDVESVDPDDFLNKKLTVTESLKDFFENIDTSKIKDNYLETKISELPSDYDNPIKQVMSTNTYSHHSPVLDGDFKNNVFKDSRGNIIERPKESPFNTYAKCWENIDNDESSLIHKATEQQKEEYIETVKEELKIKEEKEIVILPSPTEPKIVVGQLVKLDNTEIIYFVTEKTISGSVRIKKLNDDSNKEEYIDNLCRLKVVSQDELFKK